MVLAVIVVAASVPEVVYGPTDRLVPLITIPVVLVLLSVSVLVRTPLVKEVVGNALTAFARSLWVRLPKRCRCGAPRSVQGASVWAPHLEQGAAQTFAIR